MKKLIIGMCTIYLSFFCTISVHAGTATNSGTGYNTTAAYA